MFEQEIIVSLLITIFALCLHYYIGVIDLWYMPAVEICISLAFYELIKAMHKSYKTYEDHNKIQQKARQHEFNLMTELNTNKNIHIKPTEDEQKVSKTQKDPKTISFHENKDVRYFRDDDKMFDNVEITDGKEEEVMSDTTVSDNDEVMSLEEIITPNIEKNT